MSQARQQGIDAARIVILFGGCKLQPRCDVLMLGNLFIMNLMNRNSSAIHVSYREHGATHSPALAHVVFSPQLYRRDADLSESYTCSMEFEAVMIVAAGRLRQNPSAVTAIHNNLPFLFSFQSYNTWQLYPELDQNTKEKKPPPRKSQAQKQKSLSRLSKHHHPWHLPIQSRKTSC